MNSWHLTSRLTARSFSESTASRVRSGRCPRQCATLLHGQMYLQEKTPVLQFGHTLEQNSSICPIISYLWMVDLVMRLFSCGASLWRPSTRIRPKKGPAPWILFLTPAPWPLQVTFFWLVKLNICGCTPFARTNVFSEKKNLFCNLGALTQNSWIRPIMSYLWMIGLVMRLFSCGPTFEDHPQVFSQKKVQPLGFYFWHLRLGLFKSLFWLVKLNICVCTLLQGQMYFQPKKKLFCNLGALTQNSWIRPIMSYLWMIGLVMRLFSCGPTFEDHPQVFSQKRSSPLDFILTPAPRPLQVTFFLVGEAEHMWLYPFCKDKCIFRKKKSLFCNLGALTQNSWIRPIMSYLWMIGLVMRLFSCGPTFEDHPQYSVKKGPVPWILFLTPAPWPLEVTFLVGEGEHMRLYPFAKSCKESYPLN